MLLIKSTWQILLRGELTFQLIEILSLTCILSYIEHLSNKASLCVVNCSFVIERAGFGI